jgi:hypothetical protein
MPSNSKVRFRDRIKGRPQSNNIEVVSKEEGARRIRQADAAQSAAANPRTLNPEPIEYNMEKNNTDRAKGALGAHVGKDLKNHLSRRARVKDPAPGTFEKDAEFFRHKDI